MIKKISWEKLTVISYESSLPGFCFSEGRLVGKIEKGKEVSNHAHYEPKDNNWISATLNCQTSKYSKSCSTHNFSKSYKDPTDSGKGLAVFTEGMSEPNAGSVDSGPDVPLDSSVEECDRQHQHVLW